MFPQEMKGWEGIEISFIQSSLDCRSMVKLRGHHLICLHFFRGEGYSEEFVLNLEKVLKEAEKEVVVVSGADDVCVACPYLEDGICRYSEDSEENITELDRLAIKLLNLQHGSRLKWSDLKEKIGEVLPEWRKYACSDCDWRKVCEKVEGWQ